jgi:hypothetical protein
MVHGARRVCLKKLELAHVVTEQLILGTKNFNLSRSVLFALLQK